MLKITRAADPIEVKQLTLCIYAPPGVGKTSTGSTADKPLLLDFDRGSHRSQFRQDVVEVSSWADVESITAEDLAPYSTVIVDTAGRALDTLTADILRKNPKMRGFGGALSLQGYGALKSSFIGWLRLLHSFGLDVVLLAHSDEQRSGDEVIERLDVQGGSKNEIYKAADAMGRLSIVSGKRVLNFNPTDAAFGKNPAQLEALTVPDFSKEPHFLGEIIAQIKTTLNKASAASVAEQATLREWRESFSSIETLDAFNAKAKELHEQPNKVKALLLSAAEAKGYVYDKKAKHFVAPAKAAA